MTRITYHILKNNKKNANFEFKDVVVMNIEGYMYCLSCNNIEFIITDNEKPYYKDPPKEITYFSYRRINHFKYHIGVKQWAFISATC